MLALFFNKSSLINELFALFWRSFRKHNLLIIIVLGGVFLSDEINCPSERLFLRLRRIKIIKDLLLESYLGQIFLYVQWSQRRLTFVALGNRLLSMMSKTAWAAVFTVVLLASVISTSINLFFVRV